jgi:glutamate decarboxylase
MVHLATVPPCTDEGADASLASGMSKVQLKLHEHDDCYTTSVYGSRFAAEDLPKHEMPDDEMPKEVAYRLIKDELSLDGNPILK